MNKEDIIRMAREAGLPYIYQTGEVANLGLVERFATLVAAAERDRICKQIAQLHDALSMASSSKVKT